VAKKKRGRPPKGDEALTEKYLVKTTKKQAKLIDAAAAEDGHAPTTYIRETVVAHASRRRKDPA
jgi:uncharacterized protein (DUF1778 family)